MMLAAITPTAAPAIAPMAALLSPPELVPATPVGIAETSAEYVVVAEVACITDDAESAADVTAALVAAAADVAAALVAAADVAAADVAAADVAALEAAATVDAAALLVAAAAAVDDAATAITMGAWDSSQDCVGEKSKWRMRRSAVTIVRNVRFWLQRAKASDVEGGGWRWGG